MFKKKIKPFEIVDRLYGVRIVVFIGVKHEDVLDYFKGLSLSDSEKDVLKKNGVARTVSIRDRSLQIIQLPEFIKIKNNASFYAILAHECNHVVSSVFSRVGIDADFNNDEAECYYLQFLVFEILKNI